MELNMNVAFDDVIGIRRHLHMYPEKGFNEYSTSAFITDYLSRLGIRVITGVAKTGVIGIIEGSPGDKSVAVRADMDCLEVTENTGAECSSKNHGFMHACGHDGHMAAVLGLAKHLSNSGKVFKNNIIFIFQPAEEGPGGAKPIVESGVLDRFNIKAFLAMHIFPEIEQGKIGCCAGPITSRNGEVDIKITGKSAHGALPHSGVDSIVAASQVIQGVQAIVSRRIDPRDNAVITFGKIYGGEARNIISGEVVLEGTIRAFSSDVFNTVKNGIDAVCRGIEIVNGCTIKAEMRDMYPEVYNDPELFNMLINCAGKRNVEVIKPLMIAEDFSYYRNYAPQLMFLLGSRNEEAGFIYPLHSSKFNFDESILINAIVLYKNMIQALDL